MLTRPSVLQVVAALSLTALAATALFGLVTYLNVRDTRETYEGLNLLVDHAIALEDLRGKYLDELNAALALGDHIDEQAIASLERSNEGVAESFSAVVASAYAVGPGPYYRARAIETRYRALSGAFYEYAELLREGRLEEADALLAAHDLERAAAMLYADLNQAAADQRRALERGHASAAAAREVWGSGVLIVAAIWTLVVLAMAVLLMRLVVVPVRRLSAATRAIAAGATDRLAPVSGPAETARLGADINEMAAALIRRSDELNAYLARDLESRTFELETLNAELMRAHAELADSKRETEEKSRLLEAALAVERSNGRLDSLTGALNYGAVMDVLENLTTSVVAETPFAVAMVDIDALKAANDLFGHPYGDAMIRAVKDAMSFGGAIVGRYGGDEFLAILPGADRSVAVHWAGALDRALATAATRHPLTGASMAVPVSVGLAVFPEDGLTPDELIAAADNAMYAARGSRGGIDPTGFPSRGVADRAARLVAQLLPLLTPPGATGDKVAALCEALARTSSLELVEIAANPVLASGHNYVAAYPRLEGAPLADRPRDLRAHPLARALMESRRPLLIEGPAGFEDLPERQRRRLEASGICSLLVVPMVLGDRFAGALMLGSGHKAAFGPGDLQFYLTLANQLISLLAVIETRQGVEAALRESGAKGNRISHLIADLVSAKRPGPPVDSVLLRRIAVGIAIATGMTPADADAIGDAALLCDVGRLVVGPDDAPAEHVLRGEALLGADEGMLFARQAARSHHERWDGLGFPDGLAGEAIPRPAAIVALALAVEAAVRESQWAGNSLDAALASVRLESGRRFSPVAVAALMRLWERDRLGLAEAPETARRAAA